MDLMCLNHLADSHWGCLSAGFPTPGTDSLLWTAIQGTRCPRIDHVRPQRPRATHSKYPNESWNVICTRMVTSTSVTSEIYSSHWEEHFKQHSRQHFHVGLSSER